MSYQVLARKWRPGRFEDLVGQTHVLKSLTHALDNDRLHHAYLFTGTRGVGKTTLARILARCLNCEQGVSSRPCGECGSCREIAEGRFMDLIEVDAASRTKVEDTRELLENVQYAPSLGRYKIYLIDEVHMLSNHSFNALLKTLEEPPPHVVFLLATTDPQKLPVTVLSRCLQFNLKNLSPQLIEEYLSTVLEREGIEFEESALWHIATSAAGSMRDALTLLDQAISYCEGQVTAAGVSTMLGTPSQTVIHELLHCLEARDAGRLLGVIDEAAQGAADFEQLLEGVLGCLHRMAIAQVVPEAIDNAHGDRDKVIELAARLTGEDVQLFYQIALKGRADMAMANDLRAMFEMLLIRMLVFSPHGVATMPARQEQTPSKTEAGAIESKHIKTAGTQKKKPLTKALREPAGAEPTESLSVVPPEPPTPKSGAAGRATKQPGLASGLDKAAWIELVNGLGLGGITGNILAHCVIVEAEAGRLELCLDETQSAVYGDEHRLRIEQALSDHFGSTIEVLIEAGVPARESPAAHNQRVRQEQLEAMRDEFEADKNVKQLVDRFSGQVLRETVTRT